MHCKKAHAPVLHLGGRSCSTVTKIHCLTCLRAEVRLHFMVLACKLQSTGFNKVGQVRSVWCPTPCSRSLCPAVWRTLGRTLLRRHRKRHVTDHCKRTCLTQLTEQHLGPRCQGQEPCQAATCSKWRKRENTDNANLYHHVVIRVERTQPLCHETFHTTGVNASMQ